MADRRRQTVAWNTCSGWTGRAVFRPCGRMTGQPNAADRFLLVARRHAHLPRAHEDRAAAVGRTLRHRRLTSTRLAATVWYPLVRKTIRVSTDSFSRRWSRCTSGRSHARRRHHRRQKLDQLLCPGTANCARPAASMGGNRAQKRSRRLQPLRLPVHPRCVAGCSCAPGKPASHIQPDADPIDDGDSLASVLSTGDAAATASR